MIQTNHLLKDEHTIDESAALKTTLTNKRLKHIDEKYGRKQCESIMLKDIERVELRYTSDRLSLYLAAGLFFFSLVVLLTFRAHLWWMFSGLALISFGYYLSRLANYMIVTKNSGYVKKIRLRYDKDEEVLEFIAKVERAMDDVRQS